jgi:hypothetical protein
MKNDEFIFDFVNFSISLFTTHLLVNYNFN